MSQVPTRVIEFFCGGVIFKNWQNFQNMAKLVKLATKKNKNLQKFPQFF
jgi:hypothetical protein